MKKYLGLTLLVVSFLAVFVYPLTAGACFFGLNQPKVPKCLR